MFYIISCRLVYRNIPCNWFHWKPSADPSDFPFGKQEGRAGEKEAFLSLFCLLAITCFTYGFFSLSLLSDRPRRCCSNNDSWTQRKRDSEPPGEEHYCDDVHNHWDTQPAEVRQPDLGGIRLHLLHCADDHLAGVAGLLLYPAIPLRKCQRQKSGERCWKGCLCFQKIQLKRKVEIANAW